MYAACIYSWTNRLVSRKIAKNCRVSGRCFDSTCWLSLSLAAVKALARNWLAKAAGLRVLNKAAFKGRKATK